MINLNNILVKCSAVLLVACIQTSGLLAMDLDGKENERNHNHLAPQAPQAANHPIVMTVGDQTKSFYSLREAHEWFHAMATYQKAALLVARANRRTEKWNAENE